MVAKELRIQIFTSTEPAQLRGSGIGSAFTHAYDPGFVHGHGSGFPHGSLPSHGKGAAGGGGGWLGLCGVTGPVVVSCHVPCCHVPDGSCTRMGSTCVTYVTFVGCVTRTRWTGGLIGKCVMAHVRISTMAIAPTSLYG